MGNIENPPETPPQVADFSLNAVIANMQDLPKNGLVEDKEQAHEMAEAHASYMEKALGSLAVVRKRCADYYCYLDGPRGMSSIAIVQLIRGHVAQKRAQAYIRKAYLAGQSTSEQ